MIAFVCGDPSVVVGSFRSREVPESFERVFDIYVDRLHARHMKISTPSTSDTGPRGGRVRDRCRWTGR